ncbi:MAG: SocA family protein [Bacteroidales bacterium]|nr:SocA family protein [Bacteroidales bacterium]
MNELSKENQNKLGNTIIFLAEKCSDLSKTKMLKLLYLIEERCALSYHMPFLGLSYKVWQAGPVADLVYDDICNEAPLLKSFVHLYMKNNCIYIAPIKDFEEDEFSETEIKVMNEIIDQYGNKTASDLVKQLHSRDSLWYGVAKENSLLQGFRNGKHASSKEIDFTKKMSAEDAAYYTELLSDLRAANYYNAHHV